jgi:hypothetical protein
MTFDDVKSIFTFNDPTADANSDKILDKVRYLYDNSETMRIKIDEWFTANSPYTLNGVAIDFSFAPPPALLFPTDATVSTPLRVEDVITGNTIIAYSQTIYLEPTSFFFSELQPSFLSNTAGESIFRASSERILAHELGHALTNIGFEPPGPTKGVQLLISKTMSSQT